MLNDQELERAGSQLEALRKHQEQCQKTTADVLQRCSDLLEDYRRLKSDYEEERDSRERYKQMAKGQERNPFVLVLVDGDGYIFDDELVSQGTEGGQRAAQRLNDAVERHLCNRGVDNCRIMVRVYANLAGLSKTASKAKLCGPEKRALAPFAAGFTRSNDLFDFVDAGDLKENADFKIRAMFRQFVGNPQCRHIFFAACHDVGYVSELTPYVGNSDRITLVKHHGFHHEFARLDLPSESFVPSRIFRTTPLDIPTPSKTPIVSTQPVVNSSVPHQKGDGPVCPFFQIGICRHGSACRNRHIRATPTKNTPSRDEYVSISGRKDPQYPVDVASLLPRQETIPKGCIMVNQSRDRLDPYIPTPSREDRMLFNARHTSHSVQLTGAEYIPGTLAPRENSMSDTDLSGNRSDYSPVSVKSGFTNVNGRHTVAGGSDSESEDPEPVIIRA